MQSVVVDIETDITKKPKVRESLLSREDDLPTEIRKRGTETLRFTGINFCYAICCS